MFTACLAVAADADWPGWLGPNHDGKSPDTGLLTVWPEGGPKLLWKATDIGSGFSSVAVAGGKVYITGDKGKTLTISAFDLAGKPLWQKDHGKNRGGPDGSRATPTLDNGLLYILNGNGLVGCYDAATGDKKWTRDAKEFGGSPGGWGYAESVLIDKNMAIFKPGGKNCIVAVDKANGQTIWQSTGFEAGPEYSSCLPLTYEGTTMIVTGTHQGIVAVNAADGKMLWSNKFSANVTANCPTPAFSDGYVFWANGYGAGGICLKLGPDNSASKVWYNRSMNCQHGGYIIDKGYIYGNHSNGWVCLDLKTGQKKWEEPGVGKGSLCWADGMLYLFGEKDGEAALATCSPTGLEIKGRVKVDGKKASWAHPVVIGGRLYLRYDTNLYCFDVKAG
jgi:outer membrane protein assembly factor BamB